MADNISSPDSDALEFLSGGGEMGGRTRAFDWSATPLGPIRGWPQSLRSALSICLNSNFPIAIYWGSDLVLLYNDEWSPIPGEKHPWALGRPAREAWPEIWHIIEPLFQRVMTDGTATRSRDQLLPMHRHGFTEECYFDYTFSPIRGESGQVEGVFNAVLETTTRVIDERRLRTLRELGAWKTGEARSTEEACHTAAHIIAETSVHSVSRVSNVERRQPTPTVTDRPPAWGAGARRSQRRHSATLSCRPRVRRGPPQFRSADRSQSARRSWHSPP